MAEELLLLLKDGKANFADVLSYIEQYFTYTPSAFKNGEVVNGVSENQGSARVLFFAQTSKLSKEDTLRLFAEHYQNVLDTPDGTNHQNIRQFMLHGWDGVSFDNGVLSAK